ncbi:LysR family transcriptional regulator [Yoonia sp. SS1-5]|uniref:LysR family transcriptional regulator n=1 Tax=Yoonia rhodophyticola TaxID=3137370 RepID=A0AAN0MBN4_9RHOB
MIRNKVTLKQIEALVFVADLGTFRKAATALGTTQPNVSVRIAALEDTLKTVLMHRDAGSVQLTDKGRAVVAAARTVLRSTEALLEVADRRDLIDEKLRLGVTELVASTWLHSYLRMLRQTYPALRVELIVDLSVEIEKHLSAGQIDLAILTGPTRNSAFASVSLGSYRYGWVASETISNSLGPRPDFARVFAHGLMSHGKHTLASRSLRRHLLDERLSPDEVVHSSSLTALRHMAADGMGVALLPRQLYTADLAAGRLYEVDCSWVAAPLDFSSCFHKDRSTLYIEKAADLAMQAAQSARE